MSLQEMYEARRRAVEAQRALLDLAATENRELTADEEQTFDRTNTEIDGYAKRIDQGVNLVEQENRDADLEERIARAEAVSGNETPNGLDAEMRAFLSGETRSLEVKPERRMTLDDFSALREHRDLTKLTAGAGANTVPIGFYAKLWEHLIEVSGIMQAGATILSTTSGETIQVPKTTAHGTGALTAEAAAITESDPVFGQASVGAYKYAVLNQVSNELITDTAVDLLGYLARQAGRAIGNAYGVHAITGTGSAQPAGLVTGATLGVTGAASVVGAFTADNLIDLQYSVIAPYRNSPACAWLMRDATVGALRKLKDTTNNYLWQPSVQVGAPDVFLGKPVYTDPNIAATGLSAKSVLFGDMSQYLVRTVSGVRFERSDEYAFNQDLVTFRTILRADSVLVDQTGAVKFFAGNAA